MSASKLVELVSQTPSFLGFVRAYLWQLQRQGAIQPEEDASKQMAAQVASAIVSVTTDRDKAGALLQELSRLLQSGSEHTPSAGLQAVLDKVVPDLPSETAAPSFEVPAPTPAPETTPETVSQDPEATENAVESQPELTPQSGPVVGRSSRTSNRRRPKPAPVPAPARAPLEDPNAGDCPETTNSPDDPEVPARSSDSDPDDGPKTARSPDENDPL
ncbi:MAG TPA: hypothetical protein PKE31_12290 [Pseudomonadota bacterium]|nr:hypothetical protein [Pseudomonadota bacterium]